jgi:hypothetical protein
VPIRMDSGARTGSGAIGTIVRVWSEGGIWDADDETTPLSNFHHMGSGFMGG